jgi:phenylacetate-CoA ligase
MYSIIEFLSKWKPHYISASPFHFKYLIKLSKEVGQSLSVKAAFTRWEILEDQTRKLISDFLHADVFDSYGAVEAGNIAWECPTHSGYHINVESVVLEILRDGEPVSSNEPGEVYVTCLWRKTMPVIRYFLGDLVTPLDDECPCGRGLPLLKNITGRMLDMDITSNGKLIRKGPKKELKSFNS